MRRRMLSVAAAATAATTSEAKVIHLQTAYHYAALSQREEELEVGALGRPVRSTGRA